MLTTATALAVAEVHDALLAVDTHADQVIECVIESEEERSSMPRRLRHEHHRHG